MDIAFICWAIVKYYSYFFYCPSCSRFGWWELFQWAPCSFDILLSILFLGFCFRAFHYFLALRYTPCLSNIVLPQLSMTFTVLTHEWKKINLWAWDNFHVPSIFISSVLCISKRFLNFWRLFLYVPFLKSLLNLSQYCFCFIFWDFGCEACEILAPWPGLEPASFALEGEVLTTGLLGKSPSRLFLRTGVVTCFEGLNSLWLLCPWWLLREIVLMISVSPQRS